MSPPRNATTTSPAASRGQAHGLLVLVILLWGINWPVMKLGLQDLTPLWLVAIRLGFGAAVLFLVLAATGRLKRPTRRDWPMLFAVGVLQMALFMPVVNTGLEAVAAGRSAILAYTTPLWVVPGAIMFLGERLTPLKLAGLVLGILGLALLFNPLALDWTSRAVLIGNGLLMLGALIWAVAVLWIRRHHWHLSTLQLAPWQMLLATLLVLPFAIVIDGDTPPRWTASAIAVVLYNGPIATAFCYWAATSVTRALPAITSTLSFLGVPCVGLAVSMLWLGEPFSPWLFGGFGLILAGVVLVTLADRRASAASPTG
ncbi:MAG: DMT family transporter [Dongiaceae bacterium]